MICRRRWRWSVVPRLPGRSAAEVAVAGRRAAVPGLAGFFAALHRPAPADAPANPFGGVTLSQKVDSDITVTVEGNEVHVTRPTDQPRHRSMHGLYRSLIHNMVVGVSEGYQIQQELVGVGYKDALLMDSLRDRDYLFPKSGNWEGVSDSGGAIGF